MTDRIDLDDLETATDDDEETGNRGDWLWRDDGPAETEAELESRPARATGSASGSHAGENADRDESDSAGADAAEPDRTPVPHVPQTGESTPVGIPKQGSDGNSSTAASAPESESAPGSASMRPMGSGGGNESDPAEETASGPHGSGPDEMTMAITYDAIKRLEHPAAVFASAYEWSDWVGIIGDVPAHVVQKFQRDHGIDVDFFNGTGTGPGERLAEIDRNSMFYADRMVVVGIAGEDEPITEAADWEFVPLETAAEKADWRLEGDSS
ncbi:DUF7124 domain-containing protein [Natronorubrum sp. FCH18a]|uniref:DUF7124 domain-containing protein n=1 Tax=Natronorubrum sp. FCH18a TaxID=3447018 RepID=UPI003F51849C